MSVVTIVFSAVAAALLGAGFVLQQRVAATAPRRDLLRLRLFADLMRRRDWLIGFGGMIAGQALSAVALASGRLTLVEPVLATNLLFALLLATRLSGQRMGVPEMAGAAALSAGVATFVISVRWSPDWRVPLPRLAQWPCAAAMVLLALVVAGVGRGRRGAIASACAYAAAAGLCFGVQDALTRRVLSTALTGPTVDVLTSWAPYALVAVAIVGLLLMQTAFGLAPLRVSLPLVTSLEAVGGIALGMVVFGDRLDVRPAAAGAEVLSLVAMVTGVFVVGRRPVLSSGIRAGRSPGHRC